MAHTVTAKLNQAAREFAGQNGVTFFVSLGEKNYDFKIKQNVWTNYDAALFAKDAQIEFYRSALVEHAIIEVSGTGIIVDDSNKEYKAKLVIQDAKLGFIQSPQNTAPQQTGQQQQGGFQAPQQQQQNQQQQNNGGFNQDQTAQQQPQQGFQNSHGFNGQNNG